MPEVEKEPSTVTAEDGHVLVKGPDAVAVKMEPEAAVETANRLAAAAAEAAGHRMIEEEADRRR
ncbi:hypothetical protein [Sphingomonas aracearum]|uniref:Uncharacterized protein n=1 Tax=Sphingomonas aracearum TaxID=2283317 RepID=A0A369W0Y7_9SPHN|nr:hypothetical protein [Sphingomonas aracearum]RDE06952.1 hypothetical protein DVW87_04590 [Sphingomonas aracearum]